MSNFKPGDVVRLKSGGPDMTVLRESTGTTPGFVCTWFGTNHDEKPKVELFPREALSLTAEAER